MKSAHWRERIACPAHCGISHGMDEWTQKMWSRHTMKYHSTLKQEATLSFVTTHIDLEKVK